MAKLSGKYLDPSSFVNETASGDNSTVAFVLTSTPASDKMLTVSIDGIISILTTEYSLSVKTVTFVTAPDNAQNIIFSYIKT